MQILGYKPYHLVETFMIHGVPHMKIVIEAIRAQHNRFLGIRRYDKADFEKFLANYDVSWECLLSMRELPVTRSCWKLLGLCVTDQDIVSD